MIIDFTVSNYRSIKDPVTLSFVAQKGRTSKGAKDSTTPTDESICAGYEVKGRDFKLLPVAAVFGANASGKSNVIRALNTLLDCMALKREGRSAFPKSLSVFVLDKQFSILPTCFELRFADEGAIFTYQLEIQGNIVTREQLEYSPPPNRRQSIRLLYRRILNLETEQYDVSSGEVFAGPHIQLLDSMQKHELYFPLLLRLKAPLVTNFVDWMALSGTGVFCGDEDFDFHLAAKWFFDTPEDKKIALAILQLFDTGLHDFEISRDEGEDDYRVQAVHESGGILRRWDFDEESLGTQRLFALLGYTLTSLALKHTLIVDEFGANFHPKITRVLISLFHKLEINPHGAQLIFTSHDNTLWRGVLRRDEIWLTEKGADQATKLTPLSAYKPRNDLALDKAYLDGRFGGVPIIGDVEEAFEKASEEKELIDAA